MAKKPDKKFVMCGDAVRAFQLLTLGLVDKVVTCKEVLGESVDEVFKKYPAALTEATARRVFSKAVGGVTSIHGFSGQLKTREDAIARFMERLAKFRPGALNRMFENHLDTLPGGVYAAVVPELKESGPFTIAPSLGWVDEKISTVEKFTGRSAQAEQKAKPRPRAEATQNAKPANKEKESEK